MYLSVPEKKACVPVRKEWTLSVPVSPSEEGMAGLTVSLSVNMAYKVRLFSNELLFNFNKENF